MSVAWTAASNFGEKLLWRAACADKCHTLLVSTGGRLLTLLSYRVDVSRLAADPYTENYIGPGNVTSAVIFAAGAALEAKTVYFLRIYTLNIVGESAKSAPLTVATGAASVPGIVRSVKMAGRTGGSITFSWYGLVLCILSGVMSAAACRLPPLDQGGKPLTQYRVCAVNCTILDLPSGYMWEAYEWTLFSVLQSSTYSVNVSARNVVGWGPVTIPFNASTLLGQCPALWLCVSSSCYTNSQERPTLAVYDSLQLRCSEAQLSCRCFHHWFVRFDSLN